MPLADWQFSYQGLVMGDQTNYVTLRLLGLDDLPDIESADLDPVRDGLVRGTDYARGRIIVAELKLIGSSAVAFKTLVADLRAATAHRADDEPAFNFKDSELEERIVYCRPRRRSLPKDFKYMAARTGIATIEWHATDYRIFSATEISSVLV